MAEAKSAAEALAHLDTIKSRHLGWEKSLQFKSTIMARWINKNFDPDVPNLDPRLAVRLLGAVYHADTGPTGNVARTKIYLRSPLVPEFAAIERQAATDFAHKLCQDQSIIQGLANWENLLRADKQNLAERITSIQCAHWQVPLATIEFADQYDSCYNLRRQTVLLGFPAARDPIQFLDILVHENTHHIHYQWTGVTREIQYDAIELQMGKGLEYSAGGIFKTIMADTKARQQLSLLQANQLHNNSFPGVGCFRGMRKPMPIERHCCHNAGIVKSIVSPMVHRLNPAIGKEGEYPADFFVIPNAALMAVLRADSMPTAMAIMNSLQR